MKITIEVEAPAFHTVAGIAQDVAPEVARLVSNQLHGAVVVVVSAVEEDSEQTEYALAEDEPVIEAPKPPVERKPRKPRTPKAPVVAAEPKPKRVRKPRTAKPKD